MEGVAMSVHDNRKRRLAKLASLIRRKLDREVSSLARAQQSFCEAVAAEDAMKQQQHVARHNARAKLAAGAQADQWQTEHAWQAKLQAWIDAASARVAKREADVAEARTRVLVAHEDLQRMNALIKRVDGARRVEALRQERKAEDDTYAALASPGPRSTGE